MKTMKSHRKIYESIGDGYVNRRIPDERIAAQLRAAMGPASNVCNVGAGAGSYEPTDLAVIAVEPSEKMIRQRLSGHRVVRACAEALPFADQSFDVAMAVLSVHHWEDAGTGLQELRRIAGRQVVLTFDPGLVDALWLVRDYLPEIRDFESRRALPMDVYKEHLNVRDVQVVRIPWNCTDGFQAAYWRRPAEYLKRDVQAAISSFAQLPDAIIRPAMQRLREDIDQGEWQRRYAGLMEQDAFDFGYRLIVAESCL